MKRYLSVPKVDRTNFNPDATLPYGLVLDDLRLTLETTHVLLQGVNSYLVSNGHPRLEEIMLGNAFAGFLSEILVKNLADRSTQLTRNRKIGGYPDLIPKGSYHKDEVLRGEGLEIKASKQRSGWQGHNPEQGWLMVFVYRIDTTTIPANNRSPTEFIEVLAAELTAEDWSFSGREGKSRRTITASVLQRGVVKMRTNWIYRKA